MRSSSTARWRVIPLFARFVRRLCAGRAPCAPTRKAAARGWPRTWPACPHRSRVHCATWRRCVSPGLLEYQAQLAPSTRGAFMKQAWLTASLLVLACAWRWRRRRAADYRNPILYADYSDPDVIRVGEPLLHDGVVVSLLAGPAIARIARPGALAARSGTRCRGCPSIAKYDLPGPLGFSDGSERARFFAEMGHRYSAGVWAPAIRHHQRPLLHLLRDAHRRHLHGVRDRSPRARGRRRSRSSPSRSSRIPVPSGMTTARPT